MQGQSEVLWSVKFDAIGTRTVDRYTSLFILGSDVEVATRKAKRFLKKDGGVNIRITAVEWRGTIDVF
jgi:hypothetical protein